MFIKPERTRGTVLLPSANVACEGYVFTPVCHSVHGWGVFASVHAGIHTPPLGRSTWADTAPPRQTPTPPAQCMLGYTHPLPSACWDIQCPVNAGIEMATAEDGMQPTGMHSCFINFCFVLQLDKDTMSICYFVETFHESIMSE